MVHDSIKGFQEHLCCQVVAYLVQVDDGRINPLIVRSDLVVLSWYLPNFKAGTDHNPSSLKGFLEQFGRVQFRPPDANFFLDWSAILRKFPFDEDGVQPLTEEASDAERATDGVGNGRSFVYDRDV